MEFGSDRYARPRGESSAVRVAVLGAGRFAREHLSSYQCIPGARVVAIADIEAGKAEAVAREFSIERWYEDPLLLLSEIRPDAVSIVTTPARHLVLASAAIAVGAGVMLEKPVVGDIRDAAELARIARDGILMPGHLLRFAAEYQDLRSRVGNREVVGLTARRNRDRGHSVYFPTEHPAMINLIHDIDQAIWIGGQRAVEVTARERSIHRTAGPDLVFARVVSGGGQIWDLHSSWLDRVDQGYAGRIEIYTSEGNETLDISAEGLDLTQALSTQLTHFLECVRQQRASDRISVDEAIHGIAIADAIITSAREGGRVVTVPSPTTQ